MKPKFSICLIVKNGGKTLPRLLESLKPFLSRDGDVCILDTGSTDDSVQIAWDAGCGVRKVGPKYVETIDPQLAGEINYRFIEGTDEFIVTAGDKYFNFSKARNEVSEMAKNDMILSLDADEVVTNLDIDKINSLIDEGFTKFDHIQIFTHDAEGREEIKFIQSKFYDRRFIKWDNIVHEMLVGNVSKTRLTEDDLRIDHWQDPGSDRSIYIKGLAVDCYLHPEKDRNCHYLARELFYSMRWKSAIKEFERHLSMILPPKEFDTTPTHMESMMFIGNAYGRMGDIDKEIEWYLKAVENDPTHRNPVVRIAQFYKWHGNKEMARKYVEEARKFPYDEKYGVSESHFNDEILELSLWTEEQIPRRIISMWIGGEMPDVAKECVATHKIPGYEHMWIDDSNYHEFDCKYLEECIGAKNFGKASDFLRMCYLEKYGGIYLDADTKIIKPFDDVLHNELFVCEEKNYFIANGIVGAKPHHPLIKEYIETLQRNYRGDGELIFQPGMGLWTEMIRHWGWIDKVKIYPSDWFLPYNHETGVTNITPDTHTMHYYLKSWIKNK